MRTLPSALAAHLATGTTTLAWCWRITRRDGTRLGFTDHDRDLVFDSTTFEAASGFTASEIKEKVGLNVDDLEVTGALVSDHLSERDLAGGRYDDAEVEIFRVNWQDTAARVLMRRGSLGEIRRSGTAFTAEVRGLAHYLQQPKGRLLQYACDADLGDGRCTVDLSLSTFRGTGAVASALSQRELTATGLSSFADDWFTRGLLAWTGGPNAGSAVEVRAHRNRAGAVSLELWQIPPHAIAAGHAFTVTAGCDKRLETCRARFANAVNFRGFPHMPGNDYVTSIARAGASTGGGRWGG